MATRRDRFVSELRKLATEKGVKFREEKSRGKGGHSMVWAGSRVTTLPARDIDPKTAKKIRKALDLE